MEPGGDDGHPDEHRGSNERHAEAARCRASSRVGIWRMAATVGTLAKPRRSSTV